MIMVNIVDATVTKEIEPNARFISLKYLDKPETKGGLYEDSIWKTGERYEILKSTLVNELLVQVIIKYHLKKQDIMMKRIYQG
ncbi:MAG: hypothetical protein KA953_04455 [Lachnospiraceae bacterium]|nr:hypothetical protein [Lachnospiraceae bacterium]